MTITSSDIGKQIMVKPKRKPNKKPSDKEIIESGNRMSEMESKSREALRKDNMYKAIGKKGTKVKPQVLKCGGKVKGKKK